MPLSAPVVGQIVKYKANSTDPELAAIVVKRPYNGVLTAFVWNTDGTTFVAVDIVYDQNGVYPRVVS